MRSIPKTRQAIPIAGIALLSTTAMLAFVQAAPAATPDRGAAAAGDIFRTMSLAEPAQTRRVSTTRPAARRTVVTTRQVYRRPVVRRAAVVAARPAVTVRPAVYGDYGRPFLAGNPFWWSRPGLYTGAAVADPVLRGPARIVRVGSWVRPRDYWWQPGAAIAAGVAFAAWPAASASVWIGTAPAANLCWYRTVPFWWWGGFWDVCQPAGTAA